MRLRSLLFVPGDRPERFVKAVASGADALILDLEDSVGIAGKPAAREAIADYLGTALAGPARYVRVNPANSEFHADDLALLETIRADGVMLPKVDGPEDVARLADRFPQLRIIPIATETPRAIFSLGRYDMMAHSLAGLTWGAEDLPAAIGATAARESDGSYTAPLQVARALTLFGAHAAGVPAIETVYPAFRDLDGLAAYAARGRRDGFSGMMAIHPTQVPVINAAFSRTEEELALARRIVAAFEAAPGAGALQLDGRMIDAPHLKQARATLAQPD